MYDRKTQDVLIKQKEQNELRGDGGGGSDRRADEINIAMEQQ